MKKLIIIPVVIICTINLMAQTNKDSSSIAKNTVFVELLGNGGLYSVNLDRILYHKKKIRISIRGGMSYVPLTISFMGGIKGLNIREGEIYNRSFVIPTEVNFIFGHNHCFEMGCGFTYTTGNKRLNYDSRLFLFLRILGYRFQKTNGGLFLRGAFVPSIKIFDFKNEILFNPDEYFFFFLGFGIGYTIKMKKQKTITTNDS